MYSPLVEIVASKGRHVLPDHHADLVAMVEPARRLDLDVLADHVETEILGFLDIVPKSLVRRSRVQSVRPPALVQRAELEERLTVESHQFRVLVLDEQ